MSNPNSAPSLNESDNTESLDKNSGKKKPVLNGKLNFVIDAKPKLSQEQIERKKKKKKKPESEDDDAVETAPSKTSKRRRKSIRARGIAKAVPTSAAPEAEAKVTEAEANETPTDQLALESDRQPEMPAEGELRIDHEEEPASLELGQLETLSHEEPNEETEKSFASEEILVSSAEADLPTAEGQEPPKPPKPPRTETAAFEPPPEVPPPFMWNVSGGNTLEANTTVDSEVSADTSEQKPAHQTTVIERGGVVGPLVAFLGANYLSKRRDRKINHDVRKLDKENGTTRKESRLDKARALFDARRRREQAIEEQNRLSKVEDELRRSVVEQVDTRTAPLNETTVSQVSTIETVPTISSQETAQQNPVKLGEVIASTAIAKEVGGKKTVKKERQPEKVAAVQDKDLGEQYVDRRRDEEQEREQLKSLERNIESLKQEQEEVKEAVFDKRHEVKDEPAGSLGSAAAFLPASMLAQAQQSQTNTITSDSPAQPTLQSGQSWQSTIQQQAQMYKASMQTGFAIGLAIVVLGILSYLVM